MSCYMKMIFRTSSMNRDAALTPLSVPEDSGIAPPKRTDVVGLDFERKFWGMGYKMIAGIDEAGRGCLAGPVVAAAVVFPHNCHLDEVRDSKQLSTIARERAEQSIRTHAIAIGIGISPPKEVDELNVLWASMEAMRRAVEALSLDPDFILIDGNRCFPRCPWPHETIVKGDARSHSIAAASIIAKTHRDRLMLRLDRESPAYKWASNKGYPTRNHYQALAEQGPTRHHRRSFRLK